MSQVYVCLNGHQWKADNIHKYNASDDSKCPECEAPMEYRSVIREKLRGIAELSTDWKYGEEGVRLLRIGQLVREILDEAI